MARKWRVSAARRAKIGSTVGVDVELGGDVRILGDRRVGSARAVRGSVARRVLAVLALEQRPVTRDELGDAVWGDALPRTWETALRGAVSQLRRAALELDPGGDELVRTAFGCYQLAPAARVDLVEAAAAVEAAAGHLAAGDPESAQAAAAAAAEVLGSGLLPGQEGEWLDEQRRRLAPLRVRALGVLSAAATACGDHTAAVDAAASAVELEPFDEGTHRHLMTAHAAAGDRASAMVAYRRCRELLADELGLEPSEETETVRRSVAEAPVAVVPRGLPRSLDLAMPLAGRVEELATAAAVWRAARAGRGGVVALAGPAGAGKSRLAAEIGAAAHGDGGVVAHGRFDYDDLGVFGAIGEVLAQFGIAWPPPEARGAAIGDRGLLFGLARSALRSAATLAGGAVVVLDDVHWADRPSLALLRDLAEDPVPGVAVVVTARDDWVPPALAELLEVVDRVDLGPLDVDATAELVACWAGQRASEGAVARLQQQTGGNPFFITAVLHDLADRGRVDLAHGLTLTGEELGGVESMTALVEAAVGRCGSGAAEVALAAAALGLEFRVDLLAEVAGRRDGALAATLERLAHVRVIGRAAQDPGRYRFVHALVRQAVLDAADPAAVRAVHGRAAAALAASAPTSPERLGHLLAARDEATLGEAVDLGLDHGAELVEAGAPDEAVAVLTTLLGWVDAAGADPRHRAAVLMALASAEVARDHLVEGRAHLRTAAELAVAAADPSVLRTGILLLRPPTPNEHDPPTIEVARRLLALAEPGSRLSVSARCWLAAEIGATEWEDAGELSGSALADARRLADPVLHRLAGLTWHLLARASTHPAERRAVLEELLALRWPGGKRASDLSALVFLAGDCLELGDRAGADRAVEAALAGTASYGATHLRWIALRNEVLLAMVDGDLERADELLARATALAQALPIPEAVTMPVFQQVLIRFHQGRFDELHPLIAAFDDGMPGGPPTIVRGWMEAELGLADAPTNVDRAVAVALDMPKSAGWTGLTGITLQAAAAVGHPATAELAARLAPLSGLHAVIVTVGYLGAVDRYLALAARAAGDEGRAAALFARAQAQHAAIGERCYSARTAREASDPAA